MSKSQFWSARSAFTPLFHLLGLHEDGRTDDDVVQTITVSDAVPTDTTQDRPNGSLHMVRGSSADLYFRKAGAWIKLAYQGAAATFTTLTATTAVSTDTVSERTAAAGVTIDSLKIKDGQILTDELVKATIAVADASGGATTAALTLTIKRADDSTAVASARQVLILAGATQYLDTADSSPTFGTATAGSIIASGNGWCLAQTSASGAFACTVTNATDETLYFSVRTPTAGVSDLTKACVVLGSNSDAATWS